MVAAKGHCGLRHGHTPAHRALRRMEIFRCLLSNRLLKRSWSPSTSLKTNERDGLPLMFISVRQSKSS